MMRYLWKSSRFFIFLKLQKRKNLTAIYMKNFRIFKNRYSYSNRVFITYVKKLDKLSHEQQKSTAPSPAPLRYLIHTFSMGAGEYCMQGWRNFLEDHTLHRSRRKDHQLKALSCADPAIVFSLTVSEL